MFRRVLVVLVIALGVSLPLYAALTGDIEGTVYDQTGAVVSGAKVTVRNLATGAVRQLTTNDVGQFAALQLELGEYQVTVEKPGMRTFTQKAIVQSTEKTRLSVNLQVGETSQTVEVQGGAAPVLDVGTSQVAQSLDAQLSVALPNQGRDPVAFAALSPGTVPVSKDNPFLGSGSFNSNGSRGRANNITVDNAVATDISTTGSAGTGTFSLDSIQEVKVITNNFSAEYGRNSGAQVQLITKSGTNNYHGSVYWFHQNAAFNARDYFDTNGFATPLIYNLWGFQAGGPVVKDKMFIYGHYEGNKIRGAGSSATASVLTDAEAAGIADPTSLAIFNANGAPQSATGTLTSAAPNKTDAHSWSLRWDENLRGSKDTLTVRYGENPVQQVTPGLTFIGTSLPNYGASVSSIDRTTFFSYTSSLSPTKVNQFRFQFLRSTPHFPPFTTLQAPFAPLVRIGPGVDDQFGVSSILPQGRTQNVYSYSDTFSWAKGRHSLKFGTDVFRYLAPSIFDSSTRGIVTFATVSDFQNGIPLSWTQNIGNSVRHNKSTDMAWFAQDDFRVTQDLTLNLGFRLESSGGVSEENNILSNLDPNNQTPLGGGGTGPLGGLDLGGQSFARTWNPAPRVGFAWNPGNGKLVVRGGYGIAYDFIFLNPITNLRFAAPFIYGISLNTSQITGPNSYANLVAGTAQIQTDTAAAIGTFLPTQVNFGSISPVNQHLENPRNQQWSFGVQYELSKDFVLKGSYIGTRNDRLQVSQPINLLPAGSVPAPATSLADEAARVPTDFKPAFVSESGTPSASSGRLDPRFNAVTQINSIGTSIYHSLQLEVTKRMSHGIEFDANYTFAHSIDDVSDSLNVLVNDSAGLEDPRSLAVNRGNSEFDIRHRFVSSFLYELPFTNHLSGALAKAFGGWKLSGILDLHSGVPTSIFAGSRYGISDNLLVGGTTATMRADGNASAFHPVPIDAVNGIPAFVTPCHRGVQTGAATCAGDNPGGFPLTQPLLGNIGTSGRNNLYLDNVSNLDFAVLKDTKITESKSLQFRWEVYNIFNHPNFSGFQNTLTSSFFGTYTSTATNMRQMQASLKFIF